MKKNWKLLTASLVVALNLATPQTTHGMDAEPANQWKTFTPHIETFKCSYEILPRDVRTLIAQHTAIAACNQNKKEVFHRLAGKKQEFFKNKTIEGKPITQLCQEVWFGVPGHEGEYQKLLKGVIRLRTAYDSNDWQDLIKIASLPIPLRSEIQLPTEGIFQGIYRWFGIRIGIPQVFTADDDKSVVWLCPRFAVAKLIETANNEDLKEILTTWDQKFSLGVFFTHTKYNKVYILRHMTNQPLSMFEDENFRKLYAEPSQVHDVPAGVVPTTRRHPIILSAFHVHFVN